MFYTYRQNNTGGSFDINDEVDIYVVIEATSANDANSIAEEKGIYFNGCELGYDCECCGDRWWPVDESDGTELLEIYGSPVSDYDDYIIHYLDGRIERSPKK